MTHAYFNIFKTTSEGIKMEGKKSPEISSSLDNHWSLIGEHLPDLQSPSLVHTFTHIQFHSYVVLHYFILKDWWGDLLVTPWWPSREDVEQTNRFGTAELEGMLAIRFHRHGELQSPQTGRDRQGPAGTRSCGWPPLCLVTTLVVPGKATEENAYSIAHSSLLTPVFSCSLPWPPSLWRTLNISCKLENLLPCVERRTRHTSCPPNGLRPNTASLQRQCGVGLAWFLLLLCPWSCHFKVRKGKSREIKFMVTPLGQFW